MAQAYQGPKNLFQIYSNMIIMNWLQKISMGIWEEIEEHGPKEFDLNNSPIDPNRIYDEYEKRENFIKNYGWAVPSKEAIETIKEFVGKDKILEIGSGLGLWAKILKEEGLYVATTDLLEDSNFCGLSLEERNKEPYTQVYKGNHLESIKFHNKSNKYNVLMIIWPPYNEPMANEALKEFAGSKFIYIGEGMGGCTGDDSFFCTLQEEWTEIESVNIPQWTGIHDYLSLWVRN